MSEIKILTMSEPDEVGTRAFTVEYQGSPFDAALLEDGSVRTIGVDLPKEILRIAHQEMALASEFDGMGIPFNEDDAGFPLIVAA